MVEKALDRISLFSKASGLTLNIKKCQILPIHICVHRNIASIRVENDIKYLGILVSNNAIRREDVNIANCILGMEKDFSRWLTTNLTIFERNLLAKAEGISKVIYPCHSMYISPKNVKKANSIIFNFLWKNKTHYIKRPQLVKEYERGGINALDFESMVGTFRIKWLKTFLMQPNSMWFHIQTSIFKQLGGIEFLVKCDFD